MHTLNLEEIQTTQFRTDKNQSLSMQTSKQTPMHSEEWEKDTKTKQKAQTSDQRKTKTTNQQTYPNSTALSSQFEFSNYEEVEDDEALSS